MQLQNWSKIFPFLLFPLIFGTTIFAQEATTTANGTDDLQIKIDQKAEQIKALEQEINQYNKELINIGNQSKTLQNTIKSLDVTKKKITSDINLTEQKINKTVLTIDQLDSDINETIKNIDNSRIALMSAFRNIDIIENMSLVEMAISSKDLNDFWQEIDNTKQIQQSIQNKAKRLSLLKVNLEDKKKGLQGQKTNLVGFKTELSGKKKAVEYTAKEKAVILAETKNKEQSFKELVQTKEEEKAQFEKELFEFESQLNIFIDKGSYPAPSRGIIFWPLDDIFVTQKFGKTIGAEKLYASGSHNGVDFRASVGTKIKSVLEGKVVGTGNTDIYKGCYSFGKWVMLRHTNGLSSIYGHLSVISVSTGQQLQTGDLIGYSGNTGYTTGPHLHLGLYATQGVRIEQFSQSRGCKQAIIPIADIKAYLDPLSYLPEL